MRRNMNPFFEPNFMRKLGIISAISILIGCCWIIFKENSSTKDWNWLEFLENTDKFLMEYHPDAKIILIWDTIFIRTMPSHWHYDRSICPEKRCIVTFNREFIDKADVVVFYPMTTSLSDLPKKRKSTQWFLIFWKETPNANSNTIPGISEKIGKSYFNLTMWYRTDADIFCPYNCILKKNDAKQKINLSIPPKFGAAIIGNCGGFSQKLINKLLEYKLSIDLHGKCYNKPVLRNEEAEREVLSQYKFFFALETDICDDYVTETFFNMKHGSVPIVMRGKDYEHFPNNSYLAIDKFPDIKAFVDYIQFVEKNATAYLKYQQWRHDYYVGDENCGQSLCFCKLCQDLHANRLPTRANFDLVNWFYKKPCNNDVYTKYSSGPINDRYVKQ